MPSLSAKIGVVAAISACFVSQPAWAHVAFLNVADAPLVPGEVVTLQWHDVIPHTTLYYHLEFLPTLMAEPESIVSNLPPDVKSYDWVVPDVSCSDCAVRVVQDNSGADYDGFFAVRIGVDPLGAGGEAGAPGTLSTTGDSVASSTGSTPAGGTSSVGTVDTTITSGTNTGSGGTGQGTSAGGEPSGSASATRSSGGCSLATESRSPRHLFWVFVGVLALLRRRAF